jgi:hypothetical protein
MKRYYLIIIFWLLGAGVACQSQPSPTPAAATVVATTAADTPAAVTATSEPIAAVESTPTDEPTPTSEPTATSTHEATATATATATAAATATATLTPVPTAAATIAAPEPTATATSSGSQAGAPPPQAGPPSGPNLLINPGFEAGQTGWRILHGGNHGDIQTYLNTDYAQFVHSGTRSAYSTRGGAIYQIFHNATPGETYRFGAWGRLWSSDNEDRASSSGAGDIQAVVCINIDGEVARYGAGTVCSPWARPLDTWQYLSVDAVAANSTIVVMLAYAFTRNDSPRHNEAIWDDTVLGLSPISVTPTPAPLPPPARPQPVPFDAHAMRDNMGHLRSQIEQIGGILDRLVRGESGQCEEFQTYYRNVAASPTYHGVPEEWQGLYNEYAFAADHVFNTNHNIHTICNQGGGYLNQQGYGVARSAINEALDRLIPALEAANARLN